MQLICENVQFMIIIIFFISRVMKKHMFEKDEKKKRDLVKKVIAYMTLGRL